MRVILMFVLFSIATAQEQHQCCDVASSIVSEFNRLHLEALDRVSQTMDAQLLQLQQAVQLAAYHVSALDERLAAQNSAMEERITSLGANVDERITSQNSATEERITSHNSAMEGQLTQIMNSLKTIPPLLKIAFFVGRSSSFGPVTRPTNVVFDRVLTNEGNGYSASTGHFTAPVSGTYQFNLVIGMPETHEGIVRIRKNSSEVAALRVTSIPYFSSASNMAILRLERGDIISLRVEGMAHLRKTAKIFGFMHSTFSGYLIDQSTP